jgi:multimeric flavodoxin WrbA
MRIVVILGSPKKNGAGMLAAKDIESVMNESDSFDFEYIQLSDVGLGLCRGCFLCISKGEEFCPMSEDREMLQARLEQADGIILISPTYVQDVPWVMKNFIDRFAFTHHRPILLDKKVMAVANGGAGLKRVRESLSMAIGGPDIVAELDYISPNWPMSPRASAKRDKAVRRSVSKFMAAIEKGGHEPTFSKYLMFRFFKDISNEMEDCLPADHRYYSNKEDYHTSVKINRVWKFFAGVIIAVLKRTMADMAPYVGEDRGDELQAPHS